MARALSNKQLAVLAVVRRHPEGITAKEIGRTITAETPCLACPPDGAVRECCRCHGQGHVYFDYGAAYQALTRLRKEGHVTRSCMRDPWGDELPMHVYFPAAQEKPSDPLEQAWNLPVFDPSGSTGRDS